MHFTEWPLSLVWYALWVLWFWSTRYVGRDSPHAPGDPAVNRFWGAVNLLASLILFGIGWAIGQPLADDPGRGGTMWLGIIVLLGHMIPAFTFWHMTLGNADLWWAVCAHDSPRWLRRWFLEH